MTCFRLALPRAKQTGECDEQTHNKPCTGSFFDVKRTVHFPGMTSRQPCKPPNAADAQPRAPTEFYSKVKP
jgi:hypothetical protein